MRDDTQRYDEFDAVVRRHKKLIRLLCWRKAEGSVEECADLMQEVLAQLWHYRYTLRPGSSQRQERAWVRWYCRSVFSHAGRKPRVETVALEEQLVAGEEETGYGEVIADLAVGLTEHEKKVLNWMLDGYRTGEIAEMLGVKAASVSQLKHRIVEKMRKRLVRQQQQEKLRNKDRR